MQIPRASDAARSLFQQLVPGDDERVEVKPMFGNVGAFVNGNMFMGVFGPDIGLKLSDADQQALRGIGGQSFGPRGRPMGGYVTLPPSFGLDESQAWVSRAVEHVGSLAPKQPRPKKGR